MSQLAGKLAFALLRRIFPLPPPDPSVPPLTEEERQSFQRRGCAQTLIFLTSGGLVWAIWYRIFKAGAGLCHHDTPGTLFVIETFWIYWLLPSMFLVPITSGILLDVYNRVTLRERYRRYELYENQRSGIDPKPMFWLLLFLSVAPAAAAFLIGVTSYTRFTAAGIEIARPLSFRSVFHDYTTVKAIEHRAYVPEGKRKAEQRFYHTILFDDGTTWSTRDGIRDPVYDLDEKIMNMVSQRSGRQIVHNH